MSNCPVCQRAYDTDHASLFTCKNHRLPLTCRHCDGHCCASCIGLEESVRHACCPHCRNERGFDRQNPAIARSLIAALQSTIDLLSDDESVSPDTVIKSESTIGSSPTSVMDQDTTVDTQSNKKRNPIKLEDTTSGFMSINSCSKRVKTEPSKVAMDVHESKQEFSKEEDFGAEKMPAMKQEITEEEDLSAEKMPAMEQEINEEEDLSAGKMPAVVLSRPTAIQAQKPASQGGSIRRQDTIQRAIEVKVEQSNAAAEERDKVKEKEPKCGIDALPPQRRARALAWLNNNIDPNPRLPPKTGRQTFRRGCHPQCITNILGGQGTHECPIVKCSKEYPEGTTNPFIKEGEFYLAGRGDWNPWGPAFPGDTGLIDSQCLNSHQAELEKGVDRTKQETFHVFVQCSQKPWEDHYHGKDARGKYIYVGKYRRLKSDEEVQETARTFLYSQLSEESQKTMASFYCKYQRTIRWFDKGKTKKAGPEELVQFLNGEETVATWITMLRTLQYRIEIVPVEYVEYDEDLYQALVDIGANNGTVATDYNHISPV